MLSPPASSKLLVAAALATMVLIWGTTWGAIRIGLEGLPPLTGVSLRFAIAGLLLLAIAGIRRVPLGRQAGERRIWLLQATLTYGIPYVLVYWAEQWVPSGLTSVLWATFPLIVSVLAPLVLESERPSLSSLAGTLLGFSGILVIFSEDLAAIAGPGVGRAAAILLLSPLASAVAHVLVKRSGTSFHPLSLTSVPMLIAAVLIGGIAGCLESIELESVTTPAIAAVFYLAVFGSAVTFTLYFWCLRQVSATRLSLVAFAVPVVALAVGVFFLGEPLTPRLLLGSALVLAGVAFAVSPGRSPSHTETQRAS